MKKEFHHIGIPTPTQQANEIYLADCRLFITDATLHEHRIEWLRFEPGTTMPPLLQKTAHVAFTVDNLDAALAGKKVIVPTFAPMDGLRVAFIDDAGAPVEFLEFAKTGQ
jgi:hypothetical protein